MPKVMDTLYVLHPIFAQITEQNSAEHLIKPLVFVQHVVPQTKTSRRESLSSSVVTWLPRAAPAW